MPGLGGYFVEHFTESKSPFSTDGTHAVGISALFVMTTLIRLLRSTARRGDPGSTFGWPRSMKRKSGEICFNSSLIGHRSRPKICANYLLRGRCHGGTQGRGRHPFPCIRLLATPTLTYHVHSCKRPGLYGRFQCDGCRGALRRTNRGHTKHTQLQLTSSLVQVLVHSLYIGWIMI